MQNPTQNMHLWLLLGRNFNELQPGLIEGGGFALDTEGILASSLSCAHSDR